MNRQKRLAIVVCLSALLGGLFGLQQAQAQDSTPVLKVAIREIAPFVIAQDDTYIGFSIDLWNAIAAQLGVDSDYLVVDSAQAMIDAVANGEADVAITSVSITAEREKQVDFSLPMFHSGLQILTRIDRQDSLISTLRTIFSPALLRGLGIAFVILLIVAHVIWFTERHSNSDFDEDYLHGIWEAFYFATVTATTVGYGDKVPRKVGGRVITLVWMLLSLFLVSYFTASITTTLTLRQLEVNIAGPEDLRGHAVGTIGGSTSADYLTNRGLSAIHYETVEDGIVALQNDQIEAFVYDAPVLSYAVLTAGDPALNLVEPIFQEEDFGVVLPEESDYLEAVNRAILELHETGAYDLMLLRWFGE